MRVDFFVVAPMGSKYRHPVEMLHAIEEMSNIASITFQEPATGELLVESDKPWRIRLQNGDMALMFKNILTAHYGLNIIEERQM